MTFILHTEAATLRIK